MDAWQQVSNACPDGMRRLKKGTTNAATCCWIWINSDEDGVRMQQRFMSGPWRRDADQMGNRVKALKTLFSKYTKWAENRSGSGEGEEAADARGFLPFEDAKFKELMALVFRPASLAYGHSSHEVSVRARGGGVGRRGEGERRGREEGGGGGGGRGVCAVLGGACCRDNGNPAAAYARPLD